MAQEFTFGAGPERLKRLLFEGLEEPEGEDDAEHSTPGPAAQGEGDWIGPYRLLRVLGEGGMGIVYLAEQAEPIKRRVALKVIKPGMDSKRVIARFEAERQAFALLDHPNIAQIHDAGTTDAGRPYFIMEYVEGPPITEHCDRHRLRIEDRLRLFQQVCLAVQHAHQKGIIHRDLKPSNILVSTEDDEAIPKIIDFGIAKAISQPLTERTLFTEDSHLLGTPEYMSPEQADMATEDIDTRSDIYSLGVLLYVLLTGALPFDSDTLRTGGIEHIRQVIRETDPKTPSTRLAKLGDEARKLAESRRTEVAALARRLHRELEWIPLKAMRKDRAERYRSAAELADDIENYLHGDPLIAGPPGPGYKLKKFVRRNRVLVGGIAAVLVVLLAGVVVSTTFAIKAERARSNQQEVSDYLLSSVMDAGRDGALLERTWEDFLDTSVKGLEGKFKDQPLVEAKLRHSLGHKHRDARKPETAIELLERAHQLRVQHLGPADERTLQTAMLLGGAYKDVGRHDVTIGMWTDQIELMRKAHGDEYWRIMLLKTAIAALHGTLGNYKEQEACLNEALERWKQLRNPYAFRGRLFAIQRSRGQNYLAQGRYAEAEQVLRQALEMDFPLDVRRLTCRKILSSVYRAQGRYAEAEQLCKWALELMREDLGEDHWATLGAKCELGRILMEQGRLTEADKLISEALRSGRVKYGDAGGNTRLFINVLAVLRTRRGRYADANDLFTEALTGNRNQLGENHPDALQTLNDFGVLRREQQRHEEAESLLRQALEHRQRKLGPDHPSCFESMHELGVLYLQQARCEDAERLLLDAYHGREAQLGPEHPHTVESLNELVTLYESWPKPDEAAKWRARLQKLEAMEE